MAMALLLERRNVDTQPWALDERMRARDDGPGVHRVRPGSHRGGERLHQSQASKDLGALQDTRQMAPVLCRKSRGLQVAARVSARGRWTNGRQVWRPIFSLVGADTTAQHRRAALVSLSIRERPLQAQVASIVIGLKRMRHAPWDEKLPWTRPLLQAGWPGCGSCALPQLSVAHSLGESRVSWVLGC